MVYLILHLRLFSWIKMLNVRLMYSQLVFIEIM